MIKIHSYKVVRTMEDDIHTLKIFFNDILHFSISGKILKIYSYITDTNKENCRYHIEYATKDIQGTASYSSKEKWESVLEILNNNL